MHQQGSAFCRNGKKQIKICLPQSEGSDKADTEGKDVQMIPCALENMYQMERKSLIIFEVTCKLSTSSWTRIDSFVFLFFLVSLCGDIPLLRDYSDGEAEKARAGTPRIYRTTFCLVSEEDDYEKKTDNMFATPRNHIMADGNLIREELEDGPAPK